MSAAPALGDQILETCSPSLTSYLPSGATAVQDVRPLALQRGVHLDGTQRLPSVQGWALAGNPFGDSWDANTQAGPVSLATGNYTVTQIDISLPAQVRWVVGRSYNSVQLTSGNAHRDSNGYQGYNWFQMSQPELVFFAGATTADDVIYLVYGADRYLEFQRTGSSANEFKGKNGAAGIIQYASGTPDTYTYYDQNGNSAKFFGGNTSGGQADWQLWKLSDPAGNLAYVGDSSSASSAVSNGYDSSKRILFAYDSADRRFSYTYTTIDGVKRLTQVKAETKSGGTWGSPSGVVERMRVTYDYYQTGDHATGDDGCLKLVTIRTGLTDSGSSLSSGIYSQTQQYFEYYQGSYNASTNPGYPYGMRYQMDPEGIRRLGSVSASDSYSAAKLKYNTDHRISSGFFNGECGCSGAPNGTYSFDYETNPSYTDNSGYDTTWMRRANIETPTGYGIVQYFDEDGQPLSRVICNVKPSLATDFWPTQIIRDSSGLVTENRSTESITSYTHNSGGVPSGTFATSGTAGLVTIYEHVTNADATLTSVIGFVKHVRWKAGTNPEIGAHPPADNPTYYLSSTEYVLDNDATYSIQKTFTSVTVNRPSISKIHSYPTAGTSALSSTEYTEYVTTPVTGELYLQKQAVKEMAVSTSHNGSGSQTEIDTYFRADQTPAFRKSARGIITYTKYTNGQMDMLVEDADTTQNGMGQDLVEFSGGIPSGFSSSGSPIHNKTIFAYDGQGRGDTTTLPSSRVTKRYYTTLSDGRLVTLSFPKFVSGSPDRFYGPVGYVIHNLARKTELRATIAVNGGNNTTSLSGWIDESVSDPITAVLVGTVQRMRVQLYNESGVRMIEADKYFLIPMSGTGAASTNFDPTVYAYNNAGQPWRIKDPTGTIRRIEYDVIGRGYRHWIGTNDHSFPGGEAAGPDNMVKVDETAFDAGGLGNSHPSTFTQFVQDNTTNQRVTTYSYDTLGRVTLVTSPQAPHTLTKYDNRNRVIAVGLYSSAPSATDDPTSTSSNRVELSETLYDERGQVYKSVRHKVNGTYSSLDDVETLTWYDPDGYPIKSKGQAFTKTRYDRLRRATHEWGLASCDDAANTYSDVYDSGTTSITGDTVLEERQTTFENSTGNVLMTATISRLHNDFGMSATTGALDTNSDGDRLKYTGADVLGRIEIVSMWYDDLDRLTDTADYGTNDATANAATFDRNGLSVPLRSSTVLVTSTGYNDDGTIRNITDPLGKVTRMVYDQLGRKTAVIRNYVNGTPSSVTGDDDLYTRYSYASGLLTEVWVDINGNGSKDSGDQLTTYNYGVTKGTSPGDSLVSSNRLLHTAVYPEQAGGQAAADRTVTYAYNAQAQQIWNQDQAGNIHEYDYDTAGRKTQDRASTVATGFDTAVRRIAFTYTSRSQVETITQYDNPTVGSGSVLDQVRYTYDDWGPVATFEQDHDSVVVGGSGVDPYKVRYTYARATGGPNVVRKTKLEQLIGSTVQQTVDYEYLSSSGGVTLDDDNASRVTTVKVGGTVRAEYRYLGIDHLVEEALAEPGVYSRAHDGNSNPAYPGYDRFYRIVQSRWTKDLATDRDIYSVDLTYDESANITSAVDNIQVDTSFNHLFDVKYTLDGINRLLRAEEGAYSGGSISGRTRDEQWKDSGGAAALSQTGNWLNHRLDLNGNGTFTNTGDLDETNTFSDANELKTRDTDSNSVVDYTLGYDLAGNCTDDGKDYVYVYDTWYRLVRVTTRGMSPTTVSEYRYNGLGFLITQRWDNSQSGGGGADGVLDSNDKTIHFTYDERWRLLAVYRESDTDPKEQYVYHNAGRVGMGRSNYGDSLVLRDKDANVAEDAAADGVLEQRTYPLQNWRGDVSIVLNSNGSGVIERVKYSAYGVPTLLSATDNDFTGVTDTVDIAVFVTRWHTAVNTPAYDVLADYDLDGSIAPADIAAFVSDWNHVPNGGRGQLSRTDSGSNCGNRIGYAGYLWDRVIGKYHTRRRVYDPARGSFLRRDPISLPGGLPSYSYADVNPVRWVDPLGLQMVFPQVIPAQPVPALRPPTTFPSTDPFQYPIQDPARVPEIEPRPNWPIDPDYIFWPWETPQPSPYRLPGTAPSREPEWRNPHPDPEWKPHKDPAPSPPVWYPDPIWRPGHFAHPPILHWDDPIPDPFAPDPEPVTQPDPKRQKTPGRPDAPPDTKPPHDPELERELCELACLEVWFMTWDDTLYGECMEDCDDDYWGYHGMPDQFRRDHQPMDALATPPAAQSSAGSGVLTTGT